jgi:hypothetical protein
VVVSLHRSLVTVKSIRPGFERGKLFCSPRSLASSNTPLSAWQVVRMERDHGDPQLATLLEASLAPLSPESLVKVIMSTARASDAAMVVALEAALRESKNGAENEALAYAAFTKKLRVDLERAEEAADERDHWKMRDISGRVVRTVERALPTVAPPLSLACRLRMLCDLGDYLGNLGRDEYHISDWSDDDILTDVDEAARAVISEAEGKLDLLPDDLLQRAAEIWSPAHWRAYDIFDNREISGLVRPPRPS